MSKYDAFNPQGSLVSLVAAVAGSAPTPIQLYAPTAAQIASGANAIDCVEITNPGAADAFLVHASTSSAAATAAAAGIPTGTGTQAGMIHLPSGSDKVYSLRSDEYYTAICAASTVQLYLLPGRGI